jgi:hypothetical protein
MQRLSPLRLAALSLALAASSAAQADDPGAYQDGTAAPSTAGHGLFGRTTQRIPAGHLCDKCAAKLRAHGGPAAVMAGDLGNCPTCVGGTDSGYAMVGGAEPAPVGVMRTDYRAMHPGMAGAPGYAAVGPQMPVAPPQTAMAPPRHRTPMVVPHLFGLSGHSPFETWSMMSYEKRRARHAAIAYGNPDTSVDGLPASMVYGRH